VAARHNLIPICVGTYERGNETCDGRSRARGSEGKPCSWRERCSAFQQHIADRGEEPEAYIEVIDTSEAIREETGMDQTGRALGRSYDDFKALLDGLSQLYEFEPAPPVKRPPPPVLKPIPERKPRPRVPERNKRTRALESTFLRQVGSELGRSLTLSKRKLILPGMLYIVDKRAVGNGYVSLYCRARGGERRKRRNCPVLIIQPRVRSVTLNVGIAADVREIQRLTTFQEFDVLDPRPNVDGAFISRCTHLDANRLKLLAEVIGRLAKASIIDLPGLMSGCGRA
jgi:hypothetical protein